MRILCAVEARLAAAKASSDPRVTAAIDAALGKPQRTAARCEHRLPAGFRPKQAVALEIAVDKARKVASVRLYYRHVNQAERYESVDMRASGSTYRASIPAGYTDSPYPLQYYFEIRESPEKAWLYPGLAENSGGLPYVVLRRV